MRGHTVGRLPLLFIASVVALAFLVTSAWSQAPLDGQSLVGEWSGSWRNKNAGHISGQYLLTIERVEGRQVHGQVEITGPQNAQFRLLGTLDGNRLTFSGPNPTEFLIEGKQIREALKGRLGATRGTSL